MKKLALLLVILSLLSKLVVAQDITQVYKDTMDHIFQHVDKSKITTGLLSDYGLQVVDPTGFNGSLNDSCFVDMDTWKKLYLGMYSSKINNAISLTAVNTVYNLIDSGFTSYPVPVAMMHYQYNKLNDDAVTSGLLQITNNQIHEVPNAASPYFTRQLFAVAPKTVYFESAAVSFEFKSALWYSNSTKTIQKREINFNNESGYLIAAWNTPVSYIFEEGGIKTIYFKLTYTDGSSYISKTNIYVNDMDEEDSEDLGIFDTILSESSFHSGGRIQVRYASNHTTIQNPLIIAEGFDPSCIMGDSITIEDFLKYSGNYNSTSFGTINIPYSGGTLLNNINFAGFDIIYLDYKNGLDDIWKNANLFKEVIRWVNNHKQGNNPNVVMGISMGGLVARIALRQMELANENHQTVKYISVDSPHKGANVPLGVQAFVRHMQNTELQICSIPIVHFFVSDFVQSIGQAIALLNSTAAKQMLIYTIDENYDFDNSVHITFQAAYDQLGFPQQCENIAISNGSSNKDSLTFSAGTNLISVQASMPFGKIGYLLISLFATCTNYPQIVLNSFILGGSELKLDMNINALKNKSAHTIYNGDLYIRKKVLWVMPVNIPILHRVVNSTSGMLPLDGAPGGQYDISMLGFGLSSLSGSITILDSTILKNTITYQANIKQPAFCFVPTVSALALNDWQTKLYQDLDNNLYSSGNTGFLRYYVQNKNELHTRFNSSADFLYKNLIYTVGITGSSSINSYNSQTYTVAINSMVGTPPSYTNIDWTTSSNISIVNRDFSTRSAAVTAAACTTGWIGCALNIGGYNYTLPRKNVTLTTAPNSAWISSTHNFSTVSLGNEFEDVLTYSNNAVASGIIAAEWREQNPSTVIFLSDYPDWDGIPGFMREVYIGSFTNNKAYVEARMQNACGWSNWRVLEYNKATTSGGSGNSGNSGDKDNPDEEEDEEEEGGGEIEGFAFTFSPNPTSNVLNIFIDSISTNQTSSSSGSGNSGSSNGNTTQNCNIKLLSGTGVTVYETNVTYNPTNFVPFSVQIPTNNIPAGTYYLHITAENHIEQRQIFVN
ncbi:hypothetical protein FACS1894201_08600 [Bacteroidia bacterium]|nr:hypothetical protein FACS1894201_08600 [Bacteroidia bacterium]